MRSAALRSSTDQSPPGGALAPPIRWAGGKRTIARHLRQLMPDSFRRYIEPMAGSAALFFEACPALALLADSNEELINYYKVLRDSPSQLVGRLTDSAASVATYYALRSSKPEDPIERAVRFAYLNRLCWNGVYRVNHNGDFNVPIGSRLPKRPWDPDHLLRCSVALKNADIRCSDVLDSVSSARPGDFIFVDPPYPKGASGVGFNRYTAETFSIDDHKRLASTIEAATERGAKVMLVLSKDPKLLRIYNLGLRKRTIPTKSLISCSGQSRGSWSECVLFNYQPGGEQ